MAANSYVHYPYPRNLWSFVFEREVLENEIPEDWEATLDHLFTTLTPREVDILLYRYRDALPLSSIGNQLEISRERVRQIAVKGARKLRHSSRLKYMQHGIQKIEESNVHAHDHEAKRKTKDLREILGDMTIEELDLDTRSINCLHRGNINYVADLLSHTVPELLSIRNLGQRSLINIEKRLSAHGLSLCPSDEYNSTSDDILHSPNYEEHRVNTSASQSMTEADAISHIRLLLLTLSRQSPDLLSSSDKEALELAIHALDLHKHFVESTKTLTTKLKIRKEELSKAREMLSSKEMELEDTKKIMNHLSRQVRDKDALIEQLQKKQ